MACSFAFRQARRHRIIMPWSTTLHHFCTASSSLSSSSLALQVLPEPEVASPSSSSPSSPSPSSPSSPSSSSSSLFLHHHRHYHRAAKFGGHRPFCLSFWRGSAFASGYSALTRKSLDTIMKLEKVQHASPEELTTAWNEYHIGRGHISAVMGTELFDLFHQRASTCPIFVIPVRRGHGYITLLVQAQMPYLLFTALEDYRTRGPDATPYLTVTHYTEFSETKGLVLVRGDVVLTSKLTDTEAKSALEAAHSFYLQNSRYRMVTTFNKDSREFEFKDVLRELKISPGF